MPPWYKILRWNDKKTSHSPKAEDLTYERCLEISSKQRKFNIADTFGEALS